MILPFLAPRYATNTMFGEALDGPLANLVVRNWGQMIFASGLLLIWAAYDPASRTPILLFSIFGKLTFIGLVVREGGRWAKKSAMVAAIGDLGLVALFVWYLLVT